MYTQIFKCIVEARLIFFLNFDVCVVCLHESLNSQECKSFEIDAVTIKKYVAEYYLLF